MPLEHSPSRTENRADNMLPTNSPQTSFTSTTCHICSNRLDDKIECLLIIKCNHAFHRACIENYLSKESECPVCRLHCDLSDLRKINFPLKQGRPKCSSRGAIAKQHQTRSFTRSGNSEQSAPLIDISITNPQENLATPPRSNNNNMSQTLSLNNNNETQVSNQSHSDSNPNNVIDYNEIKRLIENNITQILQNLNIIPSSTNLASNREQNTFSNNVNPQVRRNLSQVLSNNNNNLSPISSSFSSQQIDKVTSIIQNWGLKFDGSSNGLTVEEFIYRLKSLTQDNFNGDFSVVCKNLHILLVGKARDWYWRYHKQVDVINWSDFCEAIRFQYRDFKSSFDIREELRNRKQRQGETFDMFYEALSSIIDRLPSPLSEQELIEIITRNLKPEIRHELLYIPIHSIPHLRKLVQMRESFLNDEYVRRSISARNANQFLPRRQISELDGDFKDKIECELATSSSINAVDKTTKVPCCWNCDQLGHFYEDCLEDRTVFCYGCGAKNTYKPQCPKCLARRTPKNSNPSVPKKDQ